MTVWQVSTNNSLIARLNFALKQRSYIHWSPITSLEDRADRRNKCDVAIIGGGIVGTAISRKLKLEHNGLDVRLIEKERSLGKHQSSHNSGVMHCGIHYVAGSLKAKLCVDGIELLQRYCDDKGIRYIERGKLVVATNCSEVPVLLKLLERGRNNNVKQVKLLDSNGEIQAISSGCRGVKALWCPNTSNVNFKDVTEQLFRDFRDAGGKTVLNTKISNVTESNDCDYPINVILDEDVPIQSKYAIACGGLQSEVLSKLLPFERHQRFMSLKVDYHKIDSKYCDNLETNLYPVPDMQLPFLGAHLSPQLDHSVLLGPYAVPALKLEGYRNNEVDLAYLSEIISSYGFRNMVTRNFSKCFGQAAKAWCSDVQVKELQRLLPNLSYQHVERGPTAVQCQLLNRDGTFVDDFQFDIFNGSGIGQRIINVKFTPSPAATSCMAIADYIVDEFTKKIQHFVK